MRKLILLLTLTSLVIAGEGHEQVERVGINMTETQMEELGIKLYEVKKVPSGKILKIPAEVEENPLLNYSVYSPVEGIVRRLYVKEGDYVKKSSPIAEIYSPELADLIGEVQMAKVRMESAKKVFERDKELYSQKVIPYNRFYNSMVEYERAEGEYEALLGKLKSYGEVKDYNLLLRSPGSGYVVSQRVALGDSVGLDSLLFKIHSHEVLWVYGWAEEGSTRELREGTEARVVSSEGGLPCLVDYLGHEVDRKTRRVKVRCVVKNRNHLLKPGMFVNLLVRTAGKPAILVPKSAVQEIEGKKIVFVRSKNGFEPREIKVLRELDGFYVLSDGLKEGEKVAVSGTVFLKTRLVGVGEGGDVD